MPHDGEKPFSKELPADLQVALEEYEYARSEIHLRLGFNRQVLNLQITMLAALVGGLVAFADKHLLSNIIVQGACVAVLLINLAFILEIRQNSMHTIICGNFIVNKLMPAFPQSYTHLTAGGLLVNIRKYREHGRTRKMLYHYWSDSFLLVSTLTLVAACATFGWTLTIRPPDCWSVGCGAAVGAGCIASLVNLFGYMVSDPRHVRQGMVLAQVDTPAHRRAKDKS